MLQDDTMSPEGSDSYPMGEPESNGASDRASDGANHEATALELPAGLDAEQVLEWICQDLIRRIRQGEPVRVESYLASGPALPNPDDDLLDLLDTEICVREEVGPPPTFDEFAGRFPELRERLDSMFVLHELEAEASQQAAAAGPVGVALSVPGQIGDYEILGVLGHGAMGQVYRARQRSVHREVALKVFDIRRQTTHPTSQSRFLREAYAVAQLSHPHIVSLYELGQEGPLHYFSMELVRGESLAELVQREGPLSSQKAMQYVLQAAYGLQYVHDQQMVHRDIKPSNLLIDQQQQVKVTDLGLVKTRPAADGAPGTPLAAAHAALTTPETIVGTPAYMAPEQARNAAQVDRRADIYSLGCTLYALLTGKPPRAGDGELLLRLEPPKKSGIAERIPEPLWDLLDLMTRAQPEERLQSIGPVIAELQRLLALPREVEFHPGDSDARIRDDAIEQFSALPSVALRRALSLLVPLTCWVVGGAVALRAAPLGVAIAACGLATPLCYLLLRCAAPESSPFFAALRAWGKRHRWSLLMGATLSIGLAAWGLVELAAVPLGLSVLAVGFALALLQRLTLDRWVRRQRLTSLLSLRTLLSELEDQGVEPAQREQFVAESRWTAWEDSFEELFGYRALRRFRAARHLPPRGDALRSWRERWIEWFGGGSGEPS